MKQDIEASTESATLDAAQIVLGRMLEDARCSGDTYSVIRAHASALARFAATHLKSLPGAVDGLVESLTGIIASEIRSCHESIMELTGGKSLGKYTTDAVKAAQEGFVTLSPNVSKYCGVNIAKPANIGRLTNHRFVSMRITDIAPSECKRSKICECEDCGSLVYVWPDTPTGAHLTCNRCYVTEVEKRFTAATKAIKV